MWACWFRRFWSTGMHSILLLRALYHVGVILECTGPSRLAHSFGRLCCPESMKCAYLLHLDGVAVLSICICFLLEKRVVRCITQAAPLRYWSRTAPKRPSCLGPFRSRLEATLGRLGSVLGPSWDVLGPSWAVLGQSWALLGPSWGHVGPSWAVLGRLERSWAVLVRSWGHLGAILWPSWRHIGPSLGPSWAILGPSSAILGPSWAHLGPSWGHLGPSWGPLGAS